MYSENYSHVPYGFQPRKTYEHPTTCTDMVGCKFFNYRALLATNQIHTVYLKISVTYNGRTRQFVILDTKGVSLWNKDAVSEAGMAKYTSMISRL